MSKTRKICLRIAFGKQHVNLKIIIIPSCVLWQEELFEGLETKLANNHQRIWGPEIFLRWPVGHHIKDDHELLEVYVSILEQLFTQERLKEWCWDEYVTNYYYQLWPQVSKKIINRICLRDRSFFIKITFIIVWAQGMTGCSIRTLLRPHIPIFRQN